MPIDKIKEATEAAKAARAALVEKKTADPLAAYGEPFHRYAPKDAKDDNPKPKGRPKKGAKKEEPNVEKMERGGIKSLNESYWIERFVLCNRIKYNPTLKVWFVFQGRIWSQIETVSVCNAVLDFFRQTCNYELHKAKVTEDTASPFADAYVQTVARLAVMTSAEKIVKGVQGHKLIVDKDAFTAHPLGILTLRNGRLEIKEDGKLDWQPGEISRPEDMATSILPIDYNPQAKARKVRKWLRRIFQNRRGDISAVAKIFGAVVYGEQRWKKMALIYGPSNLGKTQIGMVAGRLVGEDKAVDIQADELGDKFEMASFLGRHLVRAAECKGDILMSKTGGMMKSICGGDPLRTRMHYSHGCPKHFGTKMLVATTDQEIKVLPGIDKPSWVTRLIYLIADGEPYPASEHDACFVERLFTDPEEASGILNFALCGIRQILRAGKGRGGEWVRSKEQMQRIEMLFDNSDSVRRWVVSCLHHSEKGTVSTKQAWESYESFCAVNRLKPWPFNAFSKLAKEAVSNVYGRTVRKDLESIGWSGLAIKGLEQVVGNLNIKEED